MDTLVTLAVLSKIFCLPSQMESTLTEKNLISGEQTFPF